MSSLLLTLLLSVFGCSDNKKESFISDTSKILDILEKVFKNKDIYTEKERKIINSYFDSKYSQPEEAIKRKIMDVTMYYFAKLKFRNREDPQNDVLVERQISEINSIRLELKSLVEEP